MQLQRWLSAVADLRNVVVDHLEIPGGTGFSNETILFDATWDDDTGTPEVHHLVARIAPQQHTVFLEANFETQYRVMDALSQHTDIPVPEMLWLERDPAWFDSPFWIMRRIDGIAPSDAPHYSSAGWLLDAGPDEQARIWWNGIGALAAVHNLDWRALGLELLDDPAAVSPRSSSSSPTTTSRSRGRRRPRADVRTRTRAPRSSGCARTDLRRIPSRWRSPGATRASRTRCTATARWSRCSTGRWSRWATRASTSGGGCSATRCSRRGAGQERLPGFPSREETVARWEQLTGRSGEDLHWFLVFAALRFTVVMLRLGHLFHEVGMIPESFGYDNAISTALDELMLEV